MFSLYDHIGLTYDTTRKADPEITRRLRKHLQVPNHHEVLDIACGTGNYTVSLEKSGLEMTGCDISQEMLNKAKRKSNSVQWDQANVNQLPYERDTFDGIACIMSIHHFDQLLTPFQEAYRVLKKGRFVIFTAAPEQMNCYWLNEYFPKAMEDSAKQMPTFSLVNKKLKEAGFRIIGHETFLVQPDLQDFFLYSGKYDPKMYLDETVRSGISTFSNLASPEEVEEGCQRLREDIRTNKIDEVISRYSSNHGDYVFVIAEKKI
ncbi:class I SAM-dependent methyltransferase [Tenuibacillus multivorans]|uniref:Ubiquinone/menaquinone biosynthesis C-methylase UbiE n=1 Tax=Tenuibacillus multivorans TaxID=237069 RepID=A0A1G9Z419_9BACI|nr:class I SAM-dependent methyltransferase [Tenuibacillus multivorans]GEL77419.1 hypothetical protein TMU01_16540 [Tenuibacillus multivorans]SDN16014.1 Ubiquinone/menaquinone biosynthesis C-methylase UbiE [Tenuibacillus multivorans]